MINVFRFVHPVPLDLSIKNGQLFQLHNGAGDRQIFWCRRRSRVIQLLAGKEAATRLFWIRATPIRNSYNDALS